MGRTRSRQGRSGLCPPPGLRQGSWRLNKWPTELTVAPNPVVAFSLSKQPFAEGGSEYPVGHVSPLRARWALVVPASGSWSSPSVTCPCCRAAGPLARAQLSFPYCAVAMATAGSASVLGEPTFASPSQTPGAAWEGGWGWDGCPGRAGPSIPVRLVLSIPRATPGGSWGWPEGQKGR